ncbi:MAG TPA: OmpA family protein [Cyclobacteriaceae bacterium]
MKKSFGLLIIFVLLVISLRAQQFYVVTGVYAQEKNAQKITGYLRVNLYNATYAKNNIDNTYYVYVLETDNKQAATEKLNELHLKEEFKDAWIYSGTLKSSNPATADGLVPEVSEEVPLNVKKSDSLNIPSTTENTIVSTEETKPELKVKGKLFEFVTSTEDGKKIVTEIHSVDYKHSRELGAYKTNQYVDIVKLFNRENNYMTLVCGVFGYQEIVKVIDYDNPDAGPDVMKDAKGAYIIPYTLQRMKKGDVSIMYHLSFYKDAVIMLSPSKTELDELVTMMSDNQEYKIKVHAHCNGNNDRRIIAMGKTKNYFDVKGSVGYPGSAKELTKLRGEAIKSYLVDHGIAEDRIDIFAWGALDMLVSKTSKSSKLNDRIEIEIMED